MNIDGYGTLRLLCGLFFIPHIIEKLRNPQASVDFFHAAKLTPEIPLTRVALVLEGTAAAGLIFNMLARWAALLAVAYLVAAAMALWKLKGKWLWHLGGVEYPILWAGCCLILSTRA